MIQNQIYVYKDLWNHAAEWLSSLKFNFIGHHFFYMYIPAEISIRYDSYHKRNKIINTILWPLIEIYDKIISYSSELTLYIVTV